MKKTGVLYLCAIWAGLAPVQQAFACACCADPGYREQMVLPVSAYDISVLSELELDGPGNLYMTACAEDCVSGLNWFQSTADTEISVSGNTVSVTLNPDTSTQTVLKADVPDEMSYLARDLKPGDASTSVWLKTEFLIPLKIFGSGPGWSGGTEAVPAELIFYGDGNACPDIALSNHWLLNVGGPEQNARFRLFGKLSNNP
ncbi:MAG: hypothetical protein ABJN26_14145 [Stappiaceae bacterium]